ncbi:MAG: hypothetical protein LUC86_00650 [Prevotellaceae bacterium]|nr:hypothetical protein [Prevotellaceae bacterium]
MRKTVLYAALAGCLACLCSCSDTILGAFGGSGVELEVVLNMPGASASQTRAVATRVGGENQTYDSLDYTTDYQYYIGAGDVYVLLFEKDEDDPDKDVLYAVPSVTIDGSNGDSKRTVRGSLSKADIDKSLKVDVCVNLAQNGCFGLSGSTQVRNKLLEYVGQTREDVYSAIGTFSYPQADSETNPYGLWSLNAEDGGRYLPMWGATSTPLYLDPDAEDTYTASCDLYRSVAKMGVTVDEQCTTFELREVYLYYINEKGKFVSSKTPSTTETIQYTEPDVPDGVSQRDIEHPLVYKFGSATSSFIDQLYITEADNQNASEPVVMVVGGIYKGGNYGGEGLGTTQQTLNYYRIDMLDNSNQYTDANGVFNIIRNHSYIFNILNANNPGTSDPDPRRAADGLEVEVLDYTDVPLNGINSQYTLTVNQSLFSFDGMTTDLGTLIVNSDALSGWELLTVWSSEDLNQNITDSEGNEITSTDSWVHLTEGEHTGVDDEVTIDVEANLGDETRSTVFVIKSGEVIKVIHVVQNYDEAANSYLLTSDGSYDLKVDERGNGTTSAWTSEDGSTSVNIDFNWGENIDGVKYVGIIWETADGFVTLDGDTDNDHIVKILADEDDDEDDAVHLSASGCIAYTVHNLLLDSYGDWTGYIFDAGNGANALIGAYDEKYDLLWSWHIWGVGDYVDGVLTDTWQVGSRGTDSYVFMDRNLGAYSCLPGSGSFGLLYQWGRKDPFIGAYREKRERNYREVPKQYVRMYTNPKTEDLWAWGDYEDSGTDESADVQYTIQNPTTILDDGLLSSDHTDETAHGLWGTTSYEYVTAESGNKTMYDPCPVGYRMPSLNAYTIYDGANDMWTSTSGNGNGNTQVQHSSHTLRYVPIVEGEDFRTGSPTGNTNAHFESDFVSDAPFYGFWLDYANQGTFADHYSTTSTTTPGVDDYLVGYYSATNIANDSYGYITDYQGSKPSWATWIPLSGIYNGSMDHFARAGLTDSGPDREPYLPASSLQVTSVLWANSPTSSHDGHYPAGLLLHGTEGAYAPLVNSTLQEYAAGTANGNGSGSGNTASVDTEGEGYWTSEHNPNSTVATIWWDDDEWNYASTINSADVTWADANGMVASGRHFHSYADDNESVLANPSYAASVRCIRDKDTKTHRDEKLMDKDGEDYTGASLDLYLYENYIDDQNCTRDEISLIVSYDEEWEVTSSGAKWISISPSSGKTSKGDGNEETITIAVNTSVDTPSVGATAAITIYFLATGATQTINVTYAGETRNSNN